MSPLSSIIIDSRGIIVDANLLALQFMQTNQNQLIGKRLENLIHKNSRPYCKRYIDQLFGSQKNQRCELQLLGEYPLNRYVRFEASVNVAGSYAHLVAIDVTEYKQVEHERQILSMAVEQSPISILVTDRAGHIEYVNQQFTNLTGYALEEVKGKMPSILQGGRTSKNTYADLWQTVLSGRTWEGKMHNRKKDGTLFWERAAISPVLDANSDISHIIALKEDITEQMRTQCALRLLTGINNVLVHSNGEQNLLHSICQKGIQDGDFLMAWIGFVQNGARRATLNEAWSLHSDKRLNIEGLTWNHSDIIGTIIDEGQVTFIPDLSAHTHENALFKMAIKMGALSLIGLPIVQNEINIGLIFFLGSDAMIPVRQEQMLFKELSDNISFGLSACRERAEQTRLQHAVFAIARGVSSGSGLEFFYELNKHLVEALEGDAGCIALLDASKPNSAKTISLIVDGEVQENFDYPLEGTPCEEVVQSDYLIVPCNVLDLFPDDQCLSKWGMNAYAGIALLDSNCKQVGLMSVIFKKPLENYKHILSSLQIFASRANGELQRRNDIAKMHEQALLIQKANDAIVTLDFGDDIQVWNDGAEQTYGWSHDEVMGKHVSSILFPEKDAYLEATQMLSENGEWIGELDVRAKSGKLLIIDSSWTLVRDEKGQPICKLFIGTDITDKKIFEAKSMRAQRLESIGTLAGGIAHDLNNVLAPILLSLETLRETTTEEDSLLLLNNMESSAKRGAALVRQVLTFARGVEGERHAVNVKHLLKEIGTVTKDTFPKKIQFSLLINQEPWLVVGDSTQLHQVFMNLCVNARDAMPRGGQLTIKTENAVIDETYASMNPGTKPVQYVMVSVEDSGTGISIKNSELIFDPFYTTKELGKGTGLGLSTSLAIVKSHGGFIQFHSKLGKGTEFRVYLPAGTISESSEKVEFKEKKKLLGQGELVLIVDDEEAIRITCKKTLKKFGYHSLSASNGAEAVALYAKQQDDIAVVLTDISMPVMDGNALIVALHDLNPNVQIIASSGLSIKDALDPMSEEKICGFIHKPYTADSLLEALANALCR